MVATLAFILWPLFALLLYRTRPVNQATTWTILGGYLLLPSGTAIKFDMIPPFDKVSIPNLAALLCCMAFALRRPPPPRNRFGLVEVILLMLVIGPFVTSELNSDPILFVGNVLPGLGMHEAVSAAIGQFIYLIPFFLGRRLLWDSADSAEILRVLVLAGLLYSLLVLFEIRMSPQLNEWIYGYSNSWFTEKRYGGFRAVVFMQNGLVVAFFVMTTAVAAAALWRTRIRVLKMVNPGAVTIYLSTVLVLCKSLGALVYGAALIPLVCFTQARLQMRIATVLATIVLAYPILRASDLVPIISIVDVARTISDERAASLEFRFDQEQQLLKHASERELFGWGGFNRSRVHSQQNGSDVSVVDGRWIITLGKFGLFGFLAEFGLLALVIFRAASALKFTQSTNDRANLAALTLILAVNMIDFLPNDSMSPITWLIAGTILGRGEAIRAFQRRQKLPIIRTKANINLQNPAPVA